MLFTQSYVEAELREQLRAAHQHAASESARADAERLKCEEQREICVVLQNEHAVATAALQRAAHTEAELQQRITELEMRPTQSPVLVAAHVSSCPPGIGHDREKAVLTPVTKEELDEAERCLAYLKHLCIRTDEAAASMLTDELKGALLSVKRAQWELLTADMQAMLRKRGHALQLPQEQEQALHARILSLEESLAKAEPNARAAALEAEVTLQLGFLIDRLVQPPRHVAVL